MYYAYIRVSTDHQNVENQKHEILTFCQKYNIQIDKWIDETIVDLVKKSRYEFFGFAPVCGYYYSMLAEIKTVKTILSCKESGFSEDLIRERVGKLNV